MLVLEQQCQSLISVADLGPQLCNKSRLLHADHSSSGAASATRLLFDVESSLLFGFGPFSQQDHPIYSLFINKLDQVVLNPS